MWPMKVERAFVVNYRFKFVRNFAECDFNECLLENRFITVTPISEKIGDRKLARSYLFSSNSLGQIMKGVERSWSAVQIASRVLAFDEWPANCLLQL